MILLFTDFGVTGPYLAQMHASIRRYSDTEVCNLIADAPVHNPRASACLLLAYMHAFPEGSVFVCVVDPDVGSGQINPVIVEAGKRLFVGPNNGLFDALMLQYPDFKISKITWHPVHLSASFHGRDLYAPVAAMLHDGSLTGQVELEYKPETMAEPDVAETIYIDHFGNVMTGLRARSFKNLISVRLQGVDFVFKRTFSDVDVGNCFSYENSNGLIELAINRGRAADHYQISIGQPVELIF